MRRRSLLVLLLALSVTPPAAAAQPLAATTVVEAGAPAYIDVELNAPLKFFGDPGKPRFSVEGSGAVVSLTLRSMTRSEGGRDAVEYIRMTADGATVTGSSGSFSCPCDDEPTVKPGRYRLYLQSDAPAKVTLNLPELAGDTVLRPVQPVRFDVGPLAQLTTGLPFTTVLGRWGEQAGDDGIMHMLATFTGSGPPTLAHAESCFLDASREQGGDAAFGPGCSGPPSPFDIVPLSDGSWGVWSTAFGFPRGRYGWGANLTHAGATIPGAGVAAWMGYADDEPPLDSSDPPPTPSPPPAPTAPAASPAGTLSLAATRLRLRGTRAAVRLHCSGPGPCRGSAGFAGARQAPVSSLAPDRSVRMRLAVPRALRRTLRRRARVPARLLLRDHAATGPTELRLHVVLIR